MPVLSHVDWQLDTQVPCFHLNRVVQMCSSRQFVSLRVLYQVQLADLQESEGVNSVDHQEQPSQDGHGESNQSSHDQKEVCPQKCLDVKLQTLTLESDHFSI